MRQTLKEEKFDKALQLRQAGLSYRAISSKIGVSKSALHKWLCNFAVETSIVNIDMKRKKHTKASSGTSRSQGAAQAEEEIARLKEELAKARKELAYQRMRADFYDEMINVAEGKFNIAIRKKAGAKQ